MVQLFSNDYFNSAGTLTLESFTTPAGSFAAHGQAVFFSQDSSRLYVVAQADGASNLQNNFAVEVFNIGSPAACDATFGSPSASIPASGSLGSVGITAAAGCIYTAASNNDWIQLTSGAYGSGDGTLGWIVRQNLSKSSRTGSISLGGRTFTITQQGSGGSQTTGAFSFAVVDAG